MNREAIITALYNLVSVSASFAYYEPKIKTLERCTVFRKPALFMFERGDIYTRTSEAIPESVVIQIDIFIYIDAGKDQSIVPSSTLNPLIDAIDTALAPSHLTGLQTLGGLASHCWIEGKIMKDAGDLDGDGVAIIPVKILVPRN